MEFSQSSGLSLADISITSNTGISDSELEDEETVLTSNKALESNGNKAAENSCRRYNLTDCRTHNFVIPFLGENGQREHSTLQAGNHTESDARLYNDHQLGKPLSPLMALGDVRFALQENCNLLSDQNLLSDLLQSLDEKLSNASQAGSSSNSYGAVNPPMSYGPPNKDPGPGLVSIPKPTVVDLSIQQMREVNFNLPLDSNASLKDVSRGLPTDVKIYEKHVTFDKSKSGNNQSQSDKGPPRRSTTETRQAHELLKQLSHLRWKLAGWESEGLDPPTDENSSLVFVHKLLQMLQVQQEQKKHLEEQLSITERKLKACIEEAGILKQLNQKRESRLHDADAEIGMLQREWISTYETNRAEVQKLQKDCDHMRKDRDSQRDRIAALEDELQNYKELCEDYQKTKCALEEAQGQFAASRKQTAEIAEENSRLNQMLQDKQKYLREIEEVKLVNVKRESEVAHSKLENLEKSHQKLMRTNAHLTDDLRMLHDQHKTLLQKAVLEEELKEAALKEKESMEEQVKSLTFKISATKSELHNHYQTQVRELVSQKKETLQEQLSVLEATLKKNLAEQLEAQRDTHRHALSKIQDGHSKEVQDLCSAHSIRVKQLQQQIQHLTVENNALKTRHQGIVTAVSSILAPQTQSHSSQIITHPILDLPWNGNMASTSTPINTRPVSPQNENVKRGKTPSKSGSRPTSGKSGRSNPCRVPRLGHVDSSSSDSDGSVFQDGKQTVRCLVGGSLVNLNDNKKIDFCSRSENTCGTSAEDPAAVRNSTEREYRSLPDLQNRVDVVESNPSLSTRVIGSSRELAIHLAQNPQTREENLNFLGNEMTHTTFRKIYRASEILQNDELSGDLPNLLEVDMEMNKLIEELKSLKSSTKTSDSEAPTHDTSFDQEPANITLRKLSQVSTLLSQYVNHVPSS